MDKLFKMAYTDEDLAVYLGDGVMVGKELQALFLKKVNVSYQTSEAMVSFWKSHGWVW